jgi:hypothetical protein
MEPSHSPPRSEINPSTGEKEPPSIREIIEYGKTHTPEEMDHFWLERVYQGDHMPQLTWRAVMLGGMLGSLMSIAHVYTTMKLGWSFGVTITAGVLSFMFWRIIRVVIPSVRPFSILENNCMQSTASAAGYSTGASLVTAFGAILLIEGKHIEWYYAAIWTFVTALLGTVIAIPMKRQMLNAEQLAFPSGIAAAETLKALYGRGREALHKAIALIVAMTVGVSLALLRKSQWFVSLLGINDDGVLPFGGQFRGVPGKALPLFGFEPSVLLIGAGMITGVRVSLSMFASSVLLYLVVGPALIDYDIQHAGVEGWVNSIAIKRNPEGEIIAAPLTRWSLWTGTSLMVMASLTSVGLQWKTIVRALRKPTTGPTGVVPNSVEVPASWFWMSFIPLSIAAIAVEYACFRINPALGLVSVLLSLILAMVACRALVSRANATHSTISSSASRQLMNSEIGSSTRSETMEARLSRKNPIHRPHSASVPCSITFIRRPEWVLP